MTPPRTEPRNTPCVLIIRDGWGRNPHSSHESFNAIELASTPVAIDLECHYPTTLIRTSGEDVGVPKGTMGNSEVGHQNIGAGRIVDQDSVRITKACREGEIASNEAIAGGIDGAKEAGGAVHLMCIASDAGVHGLLEHLYAVVEACKERGAERVLVHLFTDGRDTGPFTGRGYVKQVEEKLGEIGVGRVATICGRYYAMDRDNRWERVKRAHDVLTGRDSDAPRFETSDEAIGDYYKNPTNDSQKGDEFITPRVIGEPAPVSDGDSVIFVNYRGDRPREIVRAFVMPEFQGNVKASPDTGEAGFDRAEKIDLSSFVCMTTYEAELLEKGWVSVAFPKPPKMKNILGAYLSELGLTQFRCAETEKFPHVTFFFNDYRDEPFEGERREIIQSPKVATYDLKPEMSADGVTEAVLGRLESDDCEDVIIVNYANGDMVGHTGNLDAAVNAVKCVDRCTGRLVEATKKRGGSLIVTSDHGNAEQMFDLSTNSPHTAHTKFDVPLSIVCDGVKGVKLREGGRLADIAPTMLAMMGLEKPREMTGESLIPEGGG